VNVTSANAVKLGNDERALKAGVFVPYTTNGTGQLRIIRDTSALGMFGLLVDNKPETIKAASTVQTLK
jgi:hypothetical protein